MTSTPYEFDLESWKLDMADFVLPEGDKEAVNLAEALSSLLSNREWARRSGEPDSPITMSNNGYWLMLIGRIVLEAAEKNSMKAAQLEGIS